MKAYKKALLIISMGLSLGSCLDFDPKDKLADGNVWSEADNFKYFANNFYGWTRDFSTALYDAPHCDMRSDLAVGTNINEFSHGNNQLTSTDNNYTDGYKHIRRVNLLLQNAANYKGTTPIDTYVGEAYFFRAYCYFELVQLYGDVIWLDHPVDIDAPEMNVTRDDRGIVIDHIIKDLQSATECLPETPRDKGCLCKMIAQAFLSRVALYEGTWQKSRNGNVNTERSKTLLDIAVNAAKNVIDSKEYELFAPASLGTDGYRYLFILEDVQCCPDKSINKSSNKEYIFARLHEEVISPIGKNVTHTYANNEALTLSRKLANLYLCSDGLPIGVSQEFKGYDKWNSEFINRDNRMNATILMPDQEYYKASRKWNDSDVPVVCSATRGTGYQSRKWAAEREVSTEKEGYDYPIIRYAEILLNYAEAVYERDDKISDDDLNYSLNLVRLRANPKMPKLSNAIIQAHSTMDMRTEIRRERTVELVHEAFRIDDLKRWKTAEVEMPQNVLGIKRIGTEWETKWNTSKATNEEGCLIHEDGRAWATKNYLLPLPADQRQLNPNIGQNPGW